MATPNVSLKIVWFMALPAYADFDLRNIEDNWLEYWNIEDNWLPH